MSTHAVELLTNEASLSYLDHPVWKAISAHRIGPAGAALPFQSRLARENGWSLQQAARVVEEYRRFCFLAATSGHSVTPSDAVDQAWHLHLTYSRDYWETFCPLVLGRPLHHEPTAGGAGQRSLFFEQYAQTLKRYEEVFGESAPADLWPNAARRLIEDPKARRVHPRDGYWIPKRLAGTALLLGLIALAAFMLWR
jgi:hypothetical protein